MSGRLGDAIGARRVERCGFGYERLVMVAEALRRTGVEETAGFAALADTFEQVKGAVGDAVQGLERLDEGVGDGRLAGEVVDFVGVRFVEHLADAGTICHIAGDERDLIQDVESFKMRRRHLSFAGGSPDFIPLAKQKLCEIRTVLSGHAEDQCSSGGCGY